MIIFMVLLQILDILQLLMTNDLYQIAYGWFCFIYLMIVLGILYLKKIYINDSYNYVFYFLAFIVTFSVLFTHIETLDNSVKFILCVLRIIINIFFYNFIEANKDLLDMSKKKINNEKFNRYFDEYEKLPQNEEYSFTTIKEFFIWLKENIFTIKNQGIKDILNNGWISLIVLIYVIVLVVIGNIDDDIIRIIFLIPVFFMCCIKAFLEREKQSVKSLLFQLMMIELDLIFSYYFESSQINIYYILIHLLFWMPFITSQLRICNNDYIKEE